MNTNQELIWWYVDSNDHKVGPISKDQLRLALVSEKIATNTSVWKNGLAEWVSLDSIPELNDIIEDMPPPIVGETHSEPVQEIPVETKISESEKVIPSSKPRPWIRLWARSFDIFIFVFITAFLLGVTEALLDVEVLTAPEFMNNPLSNLFFLPLAFVVDSIAFVLFGNTPGKAILNIHLKNSDGSNLQFSQVIRRNFAVWIKGLGFGIPIITLFTMASAHGDLKKRGICTWDINQNINVEHGKVGWLRGLSYTACYLALFGFAMYMAVYESNSDTDTNTVSSSHDTSSWIWENPITYEKVSIPPAWSKAEESEAERKLIIAHNSDNSMIILIHEEIEGVNINDYVAAIKQVKADDLGLIDFNIRNSTYGDLEYESFGRTIVENESYGTYVRIGVSSKKNFWHVVLFTNINSTDLNIEAMQLAQVIFNTTKLSNVENY